MYLVWTIIMIWKVRSKLEQIEVFGSNIWTSKSLNESKIDFLCMQNVYENGIVCHRAHHGAVQILACSDNNFKVYGIGAVCPNQCSAKRKILKSSSKEQVMQIKLFLEWTTHITVTLLFKFRCISKNLWDPSPGGQNLAYTYRCTSIENRQNCY